MSSEFLNISENVGSTTSLDSLLYYMTTFTAFFIFFFNFFFLMYDNFTSFHYPVLNLCPLPLIFHCTTLRRLAPSSFHPPIRCLYVEIRSTLHSLLQNKLALFSQHFLTGQITSLLSQQTCTPPPTMIFLQSFLVPALLTELDVYHCPILCMHLQFSFINLSRKKIVTLLIFISYCLPEIYSAHHSL